MAQAVGIDLTPADSIGRLAKCRVWRFGCRHRAMIGVTSDRILGTWAAEKKRLSITFRQVLLDEDVGVGGLGEPRIGGGELETAGLVSDEFGEQGPCVWHGPASPGQWRGPTDTRGYRAAIH